MADAEEGATGVSGRAGPPPGAPGIPAEPVALLVFLLGGAYFGLKAAAVREVVRAVAVPPLPKAPPIVEGVINFRGTLVPLLDIRSRFGFPAKPLHPDQHFILAKAGARLIALRVDRVTDLLRLGPEILEPATVVPGAEYVAGIARLPDGLLVIHDLEAFLALEEGRQVDRALALETAPGVTPRDRPS